MEYKDMEINCWKDRPAIDIAFQELSYTVPGKKGEVQILKSINGIFKSKKLSAIMGPSGAGKSTLMDVLAGFKTKYVVGSISVNSELRNLRVFNKYCIYIQQEDLVQMKLTVDESMAYAADLKLGNNYSAEAKKEAVNSVLELLRLSHTRKNFVSKLSGGELKRLSIALELINNPSVLFVDEPTTGLDTAIANQVLCILKMLAQQGRTVICSIHQPTAKYFEMFDSVYILAKGKCIYQGKPICLLPHLSSVGINCPITYNLADFVVETVQGSPEDNKNINMLSEKIQNGKLWYDDVLVDCKNTLNKEFSDCPSKHLLAKDTEYPLSSYDQYKILTNRMFLQQMRSRTALFIQFFNHLGMGIFIGFTFYGTADVGYKPLTLFNFAMFVIVYYVYTYIMHPVLTYPHQIKILRREYFNRWYGLKAYYMALNTVHIPMWMFFNLMLSFPSYYLCGHPMELDRFLLFYVANFLISIASEAHGILLGSLFNEATGSILMVSIFAPNLLLGVYAIGTKDRNVIADYCLKFSFIRIGTGLVVHSLFGYDRLPLKCYEEFCLYQNPNVILEITGYTNFSLLYDTGLLILYILIIKALIYFALRFRLSPEISNKFLTSFIGLIKH